MRVLIKRFALPSTAQTIQRQMAMATSIVIFVVATMLWSRAVSGQECGTITGLVTDWRGNVKRNVTVEFFQGKRLYLHSTTNSSGEYGPVPTSIASDEVQDSTPSMPRLLRNYPNPFNPSTTIRYSISRPGFVELKIFNLLGHPVRTLVRSDHLDGEYEAAWDGRGGAGHDVAAGVYFYRLRANDRVLTEKMVKVDGGSAPVPRMDLNPPILKRVTGRGKRSEPAVVREGIDLAGERFTVWLEGPGVLRQWTRTVIPANCEVDFAVVQDPAAPEQPGLVHETVVSDGKVDTMRTFPAEEFVFEERGEEPYTDEVINEDLKAVISLCEDDAPTAREISGMETVRSLLLGGEVPALPEDLPCSALRVGLLVNFFDPLPIHPFPQLLVDQPFECADNQVVRESINEIVGDIERDRRAFYDSLKAIERQYDATVGEHDFWLVKAIAMQISLGRIRSFVDTVGRVHNIEYIEPRYATNTLPGTTQSNRPPPGTPRDGRRAINSDVYVTTGLEREPVALLDSGINPHAHLNNSIEEAFNCLTGSKKVCDDQSSTGPPPDCCGHGSRAAAIMGAETGDADNNGVARVRLSSFKYTDTNDRKAIDKVDILRALQHARSLGLGVIVAEMQFADKDPRNTVSKTADKAFDSNAVVIAANGNQDRKWKTVFAPANAHKTIGVGSFCVTDPSRTPDSVLAPGPTKDDRIKPDILAPINTKTTVHKDPLLGTSEATAYAGGAAALLRQFIHESGNSVAPGHIYARLIMFGTNRDFNVMSDDQLGMRGAGPLRLVKDGRFRHGSVAVPKENNGVPGSPKCRECKITVWPFTDFLNCAIWWPESGKKHRKMTLTLVHRPTGQTFESTHESSVFQKIRIPGPRVGEWTIQIENESDRDRIVYWSAHAR